MFASLKLSQNGLSRRNLLRGACLFLSKMQSEAADCFKLNTIPRFDCWPDLLWACKWRFFSPLLAVFGYKSKQTLSRPYISMKVFLRTTTSDVAQCLGICKLSGSLATHTRPLWSTSREWESKNNESETIQFIFFFSPSHSNKATLVIVHWATWVMGARLASSSIWTRWCINKIY